MGGQCRPAGFARACDWGILAVCLLAVMAAAAFLPERSAAVETSGPPAEDIRVNGERLLRSLEDLAAIGRTPDGGVDRVAFSDADRDGRERVAALMTDAGLDVAMDAAANVIGRREGVQPGLPPLIVGSHTDTVPNGGRFDGALGVLAAIECARRLGETGGGLRHPLEVVVFTDEEGGLIGSRAMVGGLEAEDLAVVSQSGKTVREGIRFLGGNPDRFSEVARRAGGAAAYLELHIEQGGILEDRGVPIGVVEGIVGIVRWDVTFEGFANHAGTTPMDGRRDALLAAARFVNAVNRIVRSEPGRQVGTVGRIRVEPGAVNVIPGRAELSLELRDLSAEKIQALFARIRDEAGEIAETGTTVSFTAIETTAPALTDPRLRDWIRASAAELGFESLDMPSGAGHDAQSLAKIAPIGMIFIPSRGGISHSPRESSRPEDLVAGADVLLQALLRADAGLR